MASDNQAPTKAEIERQLARMLSATRFVRAQRRARFLELIVHLSIANKEITETIIGQDLFPPYDTENPIVRVTATNLRKDLAQYYANEGRDDPLRIDLPAGRYIPVFTSVEASRRVQQLQLRAQQYAGVNFPESVDASLTTLRHLISDYPEFAPVHAAYAELCLKWLCCNVYSTLSHDSLLSAATNFALTASNLDQSLALPHIVQGAIHCCYFEWEKADKAFNAALARAPEQTRNHWWYAAFLLATGHKALAVNLVRASAQSSMGDANAYGILQLFLYAVRDYDGLEDQEEVIGRNPGRGWMLDVLISCYFLARYGDPSIKGYDYIDDAIQIHTLIPHQLDYQNVVPYSNMPYLGLRILAGTLSANSSEREEAARYILWLRNDMRQEWERKQRLPGGVIFNGRTPTRDPVQLALSCIAGSTTVPDAEQRAEYDACGHLAMACDQHNPLMVWLHLWPIFDPLRSDPKFKLLIKRMNLPQSL